MSKGVAVVARYYPLAGPYNGRTVNYRGYDPSKTGIAKLAVGPEIRTIISTLTEAAVGHAELISPTDSGDYRSSFDSDVRLILDFPERRGSGPPLARWAGVVYNTSSKAKIVEVGAKKTRPYRIFRRTLEWIELIADD